MSSSNTLAALIRRTPSGRDEYHSVTYAETFTVLPGIYWPDTTTEATDRQDRVEWSTTVCLPTGTDASAVDEVIPQVVVDELGRPVLDGDGHPQGERFQVDGNPTVWPAHPHDGWQPPFSVVLTLKRQVG